MRLVVDHLRRRRCQFRRRLHPWVKKRSRHMTGVWVPAWLKPRSNSEAHPCNHRRMLPWTMPLPLTPTQQERMSPSQHPLQQRRPPHSLPPTPRQAEDRNEASVDKNWGNCCCYCCYWNVIFDDDDANDEVDWKRRKKRKRKKTIRTRKHRGDCDVDSQLRWRCCENRLICRLGDPLHRRYHR